jgi:hypothetical protein
MSLDVPKGESADCRSNRLSQTQVCILQERETELVVLTYANEGSSSIEPLSKKYVRCDLRYGQPNSTSARRK